MDEAFKSIKLIKKESVWENMAQMCVKSHRIDVAKVCLGNMGNVKGIRLLRDEAGRGADSDTQVALIALNLGMLDEAEKLFISAKRYDLLNKFYQNTDQWNKALEVANKFDKIHLRNTYYSYAKFCEERSELGRAIEFYEKSDTHRVEVPRMFLERDELISLQKYTEKNRDKKLLQWWGHYFESIGNTESALNCYKVAEDNLSICRAFCLIDDIKSAKQLCEDTDDSPACYHLARHFERKKNYKDAISYYQRAGAISNAIRICKEQEIKDSLASLAFQGSSQDMLDAARYYERIPGQEDKAVLLYHKAGHTSKAVNLAFKANKYAELSLITDGLNEKTDPQLVRRVAEFFLENEQFDKAVDLLAVTKKVDQAIELMIKHNVPITEELTEKLTPPKRMLKCFFIIIYNLSINQ
jgi:intraflagellar transport protein 140